MWRNLKKDQKYITRIKRSFPHWYICSSNKWRKAISWTELYNAKNTFRFKTMSTPCSCAICKGERYNRCLELLEYLIAVLNELDETDNRDKFVEDVGEDLALAILEYEMCKQVFANAVREGYENE